MMPTVTLRLREAGSPDLTLPAAFHLNLPAAKVLTAGQEAGLYRAALARTPGSVAARRTLAAQLALLDRFEEAIAVCEASPEEDFLLLALHADALLSLETEAANRACVEVCGRALALADSPRRRANVLALRGKAETRLGLLPEAEATLGEALALDPANKDGWKRWAALLLKAGRTEEVLTRVQALRSAGVRHSRLVASESLAWAQQGEITRARQRQGLAEFLRAFTPEPPPGWPSLQSFTDELAAELGAHPGLRYGRYGKASTRSWRIDEPGLKRLRVFPQLQELVRREVLRYAETLPESDHPFPHARPREAELRNWCVVAEGEGHEAWHVHQEGWLSGTFYVQVPESITSGSDERGCIAFGLPKGDVGTAHAAEFGEQLIRPRPGLMTLFPSHSFHRTYPHGGEGRRICYAFDVIDRTAQGAG